MKLQHLHGQVRAVSDECLVLAHGSLLLAGSHSHSCIQYPGYCNKLRYLHAQVRAESGESPVHVHGSPLLAGNHLDNCIQYPSCGKK